MDLWVEEGSVEVKPIDNQFNDAIKKYRKKKDQDAVDDIINPYERRSEELNDSNDSN